MSAPQRQDDHPDTPPTAITLWHLAVPLRHAFEASHGTEARREVVLVRVETADGAMGLGECDALSRPTYTHEYTRGAFVLLRDELVPALLAGAPPPDRFHPMARAALTTALLDLRLRRADCSLAAHLGATRTTLARTAVLGRHPHTDALLAAVDSALSAGAVLVKLKVAGLEDLAQTAVVRATFPQLALAADANGALAGLTPAELIAAGLERLGLTYLEQPYPAEDLLGCAALRRAVGTPIALDESVTSAAAARTALALGSLDAINIKPARLGGVAEAAALVAWARAEGLRAFCGGMLELGVGRAAAAAVAALDGCDWPTDLGPSTAYVARDITNPVLTDPNGHLVVPGGPGLGVELTADTALAEVTVERVILRRERTGLRP
ncbi:MAG: enolase C-terminal domain-like protein [Acidimicrobiales bacterium]